jgi:hypothetical protein
MYIGPTAETALEIGQQCLTVYNERQYGYTYLIAAVVVPV